MHAIHDPLYVTHTKQTTPTNECMAIHEISQYSLIHLLLNVCARQHAHTPNLTAKQKELTPKVKYTKQWALCTERNNVKRSHVHVGNNHIVNLFLCVSSSILYCIRYRIKFKIQNTRECDSLIHSSQFKRLRNFRAYDTNSHSYIGNGLNSLISLCSLSAYLKWGRLEPQIQRAFEINRCLHIWTMNKHFNSWRAVIQT